MRKLLCVGAIVVMLCTSIVGCSNEKEESMTSSNSSSGNSGQSTTEVNDIRENTTVEGETDSKEKNVISDFKVEGTDSYTIIAYVGELEDITIPKELNGVPVVALHCEEKYGSTNKKVTKIRFEEGVELSITETEGFKVLEEVHFPETGKISIGDNSMCEHDFKKILFTESISSIGVEAFMDCEELESIEFRCSDGYKIGKYAFRGCKSLADIEFLAGKPAEIWLNAFRESIVEKIYIPKLMSDDSPLYGSFMNMSSLKEIHIVNGAIQFVSEFSTNCPQATLIDLGRAYFTSDDPNVKSIAFFSPKPDMPVHITYLVNNAHPESERILHDIDVYFDDVILHCADFE